MQYQGLINTLRRPLLLAFAHFLDVSITRDSRVAGGEVHCW